MMTERIKLTEDDIFMSDGDVGREYLSININQSIEEFNQLKQQILEDQEKAKFAAGLHEENQKMLETITKQRIANEMYERENKELYKKITEVRDEMKKLLEEKP